VYQVLRTISRNQKARVNASNATEAQLVAEDLPDSKWDDIYEDFSVDVFSTELVEDVEETDDVTRQDLAEDPTLSVRN
jgi:hypothetical protein